MVGDAIKGFRTTVEKTNQWLEEIGQDLSWHDRRKCYRALRATLHALRDRLSVDEAAHLGAQLPMLIRGFYYEGWSPAGKPLRERHKEQFLKHIADEMRTPEGSGEELVARAVFRLLSRRISQGEVHDIKHSLPQELKELWP